MKNKTRPPATDSIRELARFWDTHDLTDSEDELEEVTEPVFERRSHAPNVDNHRRDEQIYVRIKENLEWLSQFEGDTGIRRAFRQLFPSAG